MYMDFELEQKVVVNFVDWLEKCNFQLSKKTELFIEEMDGKINRGYRAKEDMDEHEVLFQIPKRCVLSPSRSIVFPLILHYEYTLYESLQTKRRKVNFKLEEKLTQKQIRKKLKSKYKEVELEWIELAMVILFEKNILSHSHWAPYLHFLPPDLNVPICWLEEEQNYIKSIQNSTTFSINYEAILPIFTDFVFKFFALFFPLNLTKITFDEFKWCIGIISSYSFSSPLLTLEDDNNDNNDYFYDDQHFVSINFKNNNNNDNDFNGGDNDNGYHVDNDDGDDDDDKTKDIQPELGPDGRINNILHIRVIVNDHLKKYKWDGMMPTSSHVAMFPMADALNHKLPFPIAGGDNDDNDDDNDDEVEVDLEEIEKINDLLFPLHSFSHLISSKAEYNNARLYFPSDDDDNDDDGSNDDDDDDGDKCGDDEEKIWRMEVIRKIKAGEEIYNTYGNKGNREMLERYGFVDVFNRFDFVTISVDLLISQTKMNVSLFSFGKRRLCSSPPYPPPPLKKLSLSENDDDDDRVGGDGGDENEEGDDFEDRLKIIEEKFGDLLLCPFNILISDIKIPNEMLQLVSCLVMQRSCFDEFITQKSENKNNDNHTGDDDDEEEEEDDEISFEDVTFPADIAEKKKVYIIIEKTITHIIDEFPQFPEKPNTAKSIERWEMVKTIKMREDYIYANLLTIIRSKINEFQ